MPATSRPDLIAAIATPPGRGGIGVVRVSGPGAEDLALTLTGRVLKPRHATHVAFLDAASQPLDEGLVLFFPGPCSFTGEDVVELQGHGGPAVLQALLSRCLELGARLARAGEFTRRAYLNGKLDLAQAEAVADLIDASSQEAARSALRSLSGEFSRRVQALQHSVTELRMRVEASIDFPEEDDVVQVEMERVASGLSRTLGALDEVQAAARQGALLRDGVSVVLIGQPNVGKSSLMNALAGDEIAIVTEFAGTTRDALRQEVQIEGVSFHLIDTAGLRATDDPVEKIGIARAWTAIEQAAIALLLVDAQHGLGMAEQHIIKRLPAGIARLSVHNKIDLAGVAPRAVESGETTEVWLSAKTGEGVVLLRHELLRLAGWQPAGEGGFMARARHLAALNRARAHLLAAADLGGRLELQAEELRLAQGALSEITGEFSPDDLLGEIFSRFCVGK
ncbi:MAG TPA: tRNA uridine-5-carboxymethylaminomethyl(34) synthesis GTPase MnmE [Thiobacillaceae bacterium]|nr:tRNA uridine-5-carboxymethylaminomethyl(34) synthesis GTPase MnmE [Thiobacillaceae bacterium]